MSRVMSRPMTVSDDVEIAATPETIYDQVADPSQMGRWSPENRGATVPAPGRAAEAGMVFVGHNRRGRARWSTQCVVTAAEPGRRFAFDVRRIGVGRLLLPAAIASWEYAMEPAATGTRVTETWTDNRPWSDRVAARFDRVVTGGKLFHEFQARNIRRTLNRLKADLES